ncbi:MAG: transcriptional repressor [Bacillota bacterium]|nr:MAG: transcriptional repressor [Bacillota bacterium]
MALMLKDVYTRLLERGHKLTPQRWAIIAIFLMNRGRHLSADDVFAMLRETHPTNGIATVYRTLELLEEIDVLKKVDFGDGRARYEIRDDDSPHHHHLVCQKCGKITEFEDELLVALEETIRRKTGFQITDHVAKFYGVCAECQQAAAGASEASG